jgi:anti-anti-sigma factor
MSLDIRIDPPAGGQQRVALAGRLDTHSFAQLDQQLAPLLEADPPLSVLVLELGALEYISSAGIRSIFKARKALSAHGGKVLAVNPQPQIQKVFDLVKAVPMSEIFSSMAEADAYLDAMQKRVLSQDEID